MSVPTLNTTARKWLRRLCIGFLLAVFAVMVYGNIAKYGVGFLIFFILFAGSVAGAFFL